MPKPGWRRYGKKNKTRDKTAEAAPSAAVPAADLRKSQALKREQITPLRKQIKQMETTLHNRGQELKQVDMELAQPGFYQQPAEIITQKTGLRARLLQELEKLETEWLNVQEELDKMEQS